MITESEAHELLDRAASSIAEPAGELALAPPQRPRWIAPLVAAAAIAAAVTTGLVLVHHDNAHDQPRPVAPAPAPERFKGAVPPVFAYDGESAQKMLEERGLQVRRKVAPTNMCHVPDRALGTRPRVGFPVVPGDTVTLYVSGPPNNACRPLPSATLAWQIFDFANGRGPEPRLAPDAQFFFNGKPTTLTRVAAVLALETRLAEDSGTAFLDVQDRVAPLPCSSDPSDRQRPHSFPTAFASRHSYWMQLAVPTDGFFPTCQFTNVFLNASHEIDGIFVDAPAGFVNPPDPTPTPDRAVRPAPASRFVQFARGWMQRPGFAESVRLYNDGSLVRTLDKHRAQDRSAYDLCPGSAHPDQCGLSPVELIGRLRAAPTVSQRAGCFDGAGILPHVSGRATVLISDAGVPPCESSWVVQLEYDDQDEIVAINEFEGPS